MITGMGCTVTILACNSILVVQYLCAAAVSFTKERPDGRLFSCTVLQSCEVIVVMFMRGCVKRLMSVISGTRSCTADRCSCQRGRCGHYVCMTPVRQGCEPCLTGGSIWSVARCCGLLCKDLSECCRLGDHLLIRLPEDLRSLLDDLESSLFE